MKTRAKTVVAGGLLIGALCLVGCKAMETSSGGVSTGDPKLLTARSPGWTGVDGPTGQGVDPTKQVPGTPAKK